MNQNPVTRTISLEHIVFHVPVGYYEEERRLGNDIDVSLEVSFLQHYLPGEEKISQILNYENLLKIIQQVMGEPALFLETVCRQIMTEVRSRYPKLRRVRVTVSKLHPRMNAQMDCVSVADEWVQST